MTTIRVGVTANTKGLEENAKQVTFALSKAINACLVRAQAKQRAHMAQAFTLRRQRFDDLSVKITQFAKKTTLVGEIAMDPPGTASDNIFDKFEMGGTKKPRDGRLIAIPITGSPVKRSARTVVAEKNRPKALLSGAQTTRDGKAIARAKSFGGAFFIPPHNGKPGGIFIRAGKNVKLAYTLQPQVVVKPSLDFVATVTREINAAWPEEMPKALADAIKTARK